jgi:hypothetical protein
MNGPTKFKLGVWVALGVDQNPIDFGRGLPKVKVTIAKYRILLICSMSG